LSRERRVVGAPAPRAKLLEHKPRSWIEAKVNARWSLDFLRGQLACAHFRIVNIVDGMTRECLMA
jgi:hypothetical protein